MGDEYSELAIKQYSTIKRHINSFKLPEITISDPLKTQFRYGEKWKNYLVKIYTYKSKLNTIQFDALELSKEFKITIQMSNRILTKLFNLELISVVSRKTPLRKNNLIIGQIPAQYQITEKGILLAEEMV